MIIVLASRKIGTASHTEQSNARHIDGFSFLATGKNQFGCDIISIVITYGICIANFRYSAYNTMLPRVIASLLFIFIV